MSAQRAAEDDQPSLPRCCAEAVAAATALLRAQLSEARAEAAALREQLQRIRGNVLVALEVAPSTPPTLTPNPGSAVSLQFAEARQPERPPLRLLEPPAPFQALAPLSSSQPLFVFPARPPTNSLPVVISSVFSRLFTWPMLQAPPDAPSWSCRLHPSPLNAFSAVLPFVISPALAHLFSWPTQSAAC